MSKSSCLSRRIFFLCPSSVRKITRYACLERVQVFLASTVPDHSLRRSLLLLDQGKRASRSPRTSNMKSIISNPPSRPAPHQFRGKISARRTYLPVAYFGVRPILFLSFAP